MKITDIYTDNELAEFSSEERKKILEYYEIAQKNEEKLKNAFLKDPHSLDGILYTLRQEYNNASTNSLEGLDPKRAAILKVRDERAAKSFAELWNDLMKNHGMAYYENGKLIKLK